MNRHIRNMIILTAAVCLFALFFTLRGGKRDTDCTVALVPAQGMTILSQNPVTVKRGGTAEFRVQIDTGFYPGEASDAEYDAGVLSVYNVRDSRSVHFEPKRQCALTVSGTDAAYVELLSGSAVLSGDTASVRLVPPEHYIARNVRVNGDVYAVSSSGKVSFPVYEDSLITPEFEGEEVELFLQADAAGTVHNRDAKEVYRYGDTVTLQSEYDGSCVRFDGWTTGARLSEGGTLLSASEEVTFTLSGDTSVYANFTDMHPCTVTIDPNGGSAARSLSLGECSVGQIVYLPAVTGDLYRDGYALIGYNTRADGTGDHYAPATPMLVSPDNATVYAEWMQETPGDALNYYTMNGCVAVRGASRDIGDTLVIPAKIAGLPVKIVEDRAFKGDSTLKTVVIPAGITRVGTDAFSGCANLSTVYLPDTLNTLGDGAFDRCPSFSHLRILAKSSTRVYEKTFDAAQADRYMRLLSTGGKRIILVAGSSGSFGLNSAMLAEHYPDYEIINFSGSYQYGMLPLMFYVMNHVHEGDVVIFAPEFYPAMYANRLEYDMTNWMYLESNYNMLDDLDMQVVRGSILDNYMKFLNERRKILPGQQAGHGIYRRSAINEYGDVEARREHNTTKNEGPLTLENSLIGAGCVKAYGTACAEIAARGGVCLFSFPPVSNGKTASLERLRASYTAFTQKLAGAFADIPCTVISDAADYIFPPDAFYDNRYHMTPEGAVLRTEQLIADLDAYGLGR